MNMMRVALGVSVASLFCAGSAIAQSVVLSGILGNKALLVVDGSTPKGVAIGETHRGVKVITLQNDRADVEIEGQRVTVRLGEGPVEIVSSGSANGGARRIVLQAGTNGHFKSVGQINGKTVEFIVDTGASSVGLSVQDAQRIGLKYQEGLPISLNTANGTVLAWQVKLDQVRLGNVDVYGVDAIVSPAPMPYVLLGNSFLTRFQMTRINDQMVLEQRY